MSNEGGSYPRWKGALSTDSEYLPLVKEYMLAAHAFRDLEIVAALPAVAAAPALIKERERYISAANQAVCQFLGSSPHVLSDNHQGADKKVFDALLLKARVLYDQRDPGIGKLLRQRGCESRSSQQGADPATAWWECLKAACDPKAQS